MTQRETIYTSDIYDDRGEAAFSLDSQLESFGQHRQFHGRIRTVKCYQDNGLIAIGNEPGNGQVLVSRRSRQLTYRAAVEILPQHLLTTGGLVSLSMAQSGIVTRLKHCSWVLKLLGRIPENRPSRALANEMLR